MLPCAVCRKVLNRRCGRLENSSLNAAARDFCYSPETVFQHAPRMYLIGLWRLYPVYHNQLIQYELSHREYEL